MGSPYKGWTPYLKSDDAFIENDYNPILHGVSRAKFSNLDDFVDRFDETYPDGTTVRENFYAIFSDYSDINQVDPQKWYPRYLENLQKWRDTGKHPVVAEIAIASLYQNIAWYHRGGGYANTVTDEGWEKFRSNIELAQKTLVNASDDARKDPHYYAGYLIVGMAMSAPVEQIEELFKAGQQIDATYLPLYLNMSYLLEQKWLGSSPSHWHEWLEKSLEVDTLTQTEKDLIYGYVVRHRIRGRYGDFQTPDAAFKTMKIDKLRFMRGLASYNKKYSDSADWKSHYVYHAWKAQDEAAIIDALKLCNKHYVPNLWSGKKGDDWFKLLAKIRKRYPESEKHM